MIAGALALVVLVALGSWQLQRLGWKQDLIARAEAAAAAPALPLDQALALSDPEFRRVTARCLGLHSAPYVELRTVQDGEPGVRLISLCRAEAGPGLLVDRGFMAETVSVRPEERPSDEAVVVSGMLRRPARANAFAPPPEGRTFFDRDLAAMADRLRAPETRSDLVLFVESSRPASPLAALVPSAPPVVFSNNHLGYALTWFGLALALVGVGLARLRRRR